MSTKVSVKAVYHINGIYIRFTANRKSKYQKLFTIEKHYFKNERIVSSHPNYLKLNLIINESLQNVNVYSSNPQRQFEVLSINSFDLVVSTVFVTGHVKPPNVYCCHAKKVLITPWRKESRKHKIDETKVNLKLVNVPNNK